jgi:membrane fusion protein (multidrug efflux system)
MERIPIMKKNRNFRFGVWISLVTITVSGMVLTGAGCSKKSEEEPPKPVEEIVIPVKAAIVKRGAIDEYCKFTGTIDAVKRASIAPAIPAKIEKIMVSEGMEVKQNQALVQMDPKQLLQAKIKYDATKADYDRVKTLRERGSVTQQQFDQMQAGYDAAKTAYDQMMESTYLNAPFAGTIIGKYYNEGDLFSYLRPGPDGVVAILTVAQLSEMKIDINAPENDYVKIKVGQRAQISVSVLNNSSFTGKVSMVTPALDMLSRTAKISVSINNTSGILKPGMFASVKIITNSKANTLSAPSAAIVTIEGKPTVFTVPKSTPPFRCQPTPKIVTMGLHNEETTELIGGVEEGSLIILDGNSALESKTKINVTAIEN